VNPTEAKKEWQQQRKRKSFIGRVFGAFWMLASLLLPMGIFMLLVFEVR
jgi:hypothetical protein